MAELKSTYINGDLRASGNISANNINATSATINSLTYTTSTQSSDKRLKENIKEYTPKDSILNLPVYKFDFKDGRAKGMIGCLAQDLKKISPELVSKGADDYYVIQENKIVYLLLEELKNQAKEIEELKAEINKLKNS